MQEKFTKLYGIPGAISKVRPEDLEQHDKDQQEFTENKEELDLMEWTTKTTKRLEELKEMKKEEKKSNTKKPRQAMLG